MAAGLTIIGAAGHIFPLASFCVNYRQVVSLKARDQAGEPAELLAFSRPLVRRLRCAGRAAEASAFRLDCSCASHRGFYKLSAPLWASYVAVQVVPAGREPPLGPHESTRIAAPRARRRIARAPSNFDYASTTNRPRSAPPPRPSRAHRPRSREASPSPRPRASSRRRLTRKRTKTRSSAEN